MEQKINSKLDTHQLDFKNAIKEWLTVNQGQVMCQGTNKTSDFLQFIFDTTNLSIKKEDLQKRKRVKNLVPHCDLCIAKIASGEQCTRRKQSAEEQFCGTHIKGQPYGIETATEENTNPQMKKVDIWVQEIKGITYYIDSNNNIYKPEDIMSNKPNPAVIAKWALTANNTYIIPAFEN